MDCKIGPWPIFIKKFSFSLYWRIMILIIKVSFLNLILFWSYFSISGFYIIWAVLLCMVLRMRGPGLLVPGSILSFPHVCPWLLDYSWPCVALIISHLLRRAISLDVSFSSCTMFCLERLWYILSEISFEELPDDSYIRSNQSPMYYEAFDYIFLFY